MTIFSLLHEGDAHAIIKPFRSSTVVRNKIIAMRSPLCALSLLMWGEKEVTIVRAYKLPSQQPLFLPSLRVLCENPASHNRNGANPGNISKYPSRKNGSEGSLSFFSEKVEKNLCIYCYLKSRSLMITGTTFLIERKF